MNKTTIKIFLSFSFVSAIIATMLLVMNALGIGILITDTGIITPKHSPTSVLEDISLNLEKTDTGYTLANTNIPSEYWCILLNDDGNIVWSQISLMIFQRIILYETLQNSRIGFCAITLFLSALKTADF